jgi:hypothetical protein
MRRETVRHLIHLGGLDGPPMGSISYDGLVVLVDDRTLTHLQIVIVNKLRRGQAFLMSWKDSAEVGSGRSAIWLYPQVLIYFKFDGSRVPAINETWLRELAESAESSRGLVVTTEAGDVPNLAPKKNLLPRATVMAATSSPPAASPGPMVTAR